MAEPTGPAAAPASTLRPGLAETAPSARARGLTLALSGAFCWSLAGIMVRLAHEATSWHLILYRSLGVVLMLGTTFAVVHRGRSAGVFRRAGWPAILAGLCSSASSVLFILALGPRSPSPTPSSCPASRPFSPPSAPRPSSASASPAAPGAPWRWPAPAWS